MKAIRKCKGLSTCVLILVLLLGSCFNVFATEANPSLKDKPIKKVDINTATKEELQELPGIGPVKAQAIIEGRPYSKIEDIKKVRGIKEGTYKQIKDLITVK